MKTIKLSEDQKVNLDWMPAGYEQTQLTVCPIIDRGKIVAATFTLSNQDIEPAGDTVCHQIINNAGWDGISINGLAQNMKIYNADIWKMYWCSKCNCMSLKMYVPKKSTAFTVSTALGKLDIQWH